MAEGGIEGAARNAMETAERVMEYRMRQERYRAEENETKIIEDVTAGRISQTDARKLLARAKMHQTQSASQAEVGPGAEREASVSYQAVLAGADYETTNMMLEQMLDTEDQLRGNRWSLLIMNLLRIDKIHKRAMKERRRRKQPDFVHPFPCVHSMVKTTTFEFVVGSVMLMNAITIGLQVETTEVLAIYDYFEQFFTVFFVVEILLRFMAAGWTWIWDKHNFGDFFLIVFTGVLPMWVLRPAGVDTSVLRAFAVLRILRMIRLVRLVRTYQAFRVFWSLIQGCIDSGRTLVYMYIIIAFALYVFGIFSVYLIARDDRFADDELAFEYFGDVLKAMFTLFQVVTTDGWTEPCRPLMKKSGLVAPLFIVVILIVTFVLLNLVRAVIVNNAFERAKQDEELIAVERREAMEQEIRELQILFHEIDSDGSGMLSEEEYYEALQNNADVKDKFEVLQIEQREYKDIWFLLDDGSGEVSVDKFAECLRQLKGDAKAKDSFSLLRRVHTVNNRLRALKEVLKGHLKTAAALRGEATQVRQQLGILQHELCEFISLIQNCVPAGPVKVEESVIAHFHDKLEEASVTFSDGEALNELVDILLANSRAPGLAMQAVEKKAQGLRSRQLQGILREHSYEGGEFQDEPDLGQLLEDLTAAKEAFPALQRKAVETVLSRDFIRLRGDYLDSEATE